MYFILIRLGIILLFMLPYQRLYAQKYSLYYIDSFGKQTDNLNAQYLRHVVKEDKLYKVNDYFLNGVLHADMIFSDKKLKYKTGLSSFYTIDGKLKCQFELVKNEKEGIYELYHPNGQISTKGAYSEGKPSGVWEWYDPKGKLLNEIENCDEDKHKAYMRLAEFPGGNENLIKYLAELQYPPQALIEKKEELFYLSFFINERGFVEDIDVMIGSERVLERAIRKHLESMPAFSPAIIHGKADISCFFLPYRFQYYYKDSRKVSRHSKLKAILHSAEKDMKAGNFKKAEIKLLSSTDVYEYNKQLYYMLSECYLKLGDEELAKAFLYTAENLKERNIDLINNSDFLKELEAK